MKLLFSLKFHQEKIMHWLFWEWNYLSPGEFVSFLDFHRCFQSEWNFRIFARCCVGWTLMDPPSGWVLMLFSRFLTFGLVPSLSHVWFFVTPWTIACQASLSVTNSWSLPKLLSIESVMPPNHFILCHPLLLCPQSFPPSRSFPMSCLFASRGPSIGSCSFRTCPPNEYSGLISLGLTGLISLLSKRLWRLLLTISVVKLSQDPS